MTTTNQTPTLTEKQSATLSFQTLVELFQRDLKIPSWISYKFGISHDGIIIWNEHSNSFGFDEIALINEFCNTNAYSFSFFGRKTTSPSMYGSVACEINICN